MDWEEVGDSRLKLKHTIKIPAQLMQLHYQYNLSQKRIPKTVANFIQASSNLTRMKQFARSAAAFFL
jgi:hypothetical protein